MGEEKRIIMKIIIFETKKRHKKTTSSKKKKTEERKREREREVKVILCTIAKCEKTIRDHLRTEIEVDTRASSMSCE